MSEEGRLVERRLGGGQLIQGLGHAPAAADWPALTQAEVETVLASCPGLAPPERIEWHSPRAFSAAGVVVLGDGARLFVKRHALAVRDADALGEEHRFMAYLKTQGLASPGSAVPGLAVPDGVARIESGGWAYEVQTVPPGEDLYAEALVWTPFRSVAQAGAAGRALARLHGAAAGYDAPARPFRPLRGGFALATALDLLAAMAALVSSRPGLTAALARWDWRGDLAADLLPFHAAARIAGQAGPPLWTHGDWHAGNLLWRGDEVAAVLDFGLADRASAAFDLAVAIERNAVGWLDLPGMPGARGTCVVQEDQVGALLDGYRAAPALRRAVAALLPLAHLDLAISEVEYFHAITGSAADAALAYEAYLLGHARWFAGPEGQALLARIARA